MKIPPAQLRSISALIICLLFSQSALAAPAINSVSGNYSEGGSVSIQGASFGTGSNLVLFDNFERSVNAGTPLATGAGSATVGGWSFTTGSVYYTDTVSVSGARAFQADMANPFNGGAYSNAFAAANFTPDTQAFISWWMYLPAADKWPGENHNDGINWKIVWLMGACNYAEDMVLPVVLGAGTTVTGDPVGCDWCPGPPWPDDPANPIDDPYLGLDLEKGKWTRVWTWVKGGYSNDGAIQYWELTSSGVQARLNRNNFNTLYAPGTIRPSWCGPSSPATAMYQTVYMNAYGRITPPSHPTFDDFYLATGPNARARVEIGNQPTYMASTKLAILTTSSWTSSSITATMRLGVFRPGETAYVFVFDASGNVSPASQAITLGGTAPGDSIAPSAPVNLRTGQ